MNIRCFFCGQMIGEVTEWPEGKIPMCMECFEEATEK